MSFDFKKEYRDLYLPKTTPSFVDVPPCTFFAVEGTGNPNEEDGSYAEAMSILYGLSFTVKMSKMGAWQPKGYFDYVVPPLEGLWWTGQDAFDGTHLVDKSSLKWVSLIRQPDFVTAEVFDWAREQLLKKKPLLAEAIDRARIVRFREGACAQIMHRGPYDDEPATIERLAAFIEREGHTLDLAQDPQKVTEAIDAQGNVPKLRLHHEIYLGDPRRTKPENLRTVIRHPVR